MPVSTSVFTTAFADNRENNSSRSFLSRICVKSVRTYIHVCLRSYGLVKGELVVKNDNFQWTIYRPFCSIVFCRPSGNFVIAKKFEKVFPSTETKCFETLISSSTVKLSKPSSSKAFSPYTFSMILHSVSFLFGSKTRRKCSLVIFETRSSVFFIPRQA